MELDNELDNCAVIIQQPQDPHRGTKVEDNDMNIIQQLRKEPHRGTKVEDNDMDIIEQLQKEPHRGTREEDNDVDVIELLQQPSPWNRSGRQQISEAIKIKCTEYETVILLLTEK